MAYYSYKRVLALIPDEWSDSFDAKWKADNDAEFELTVDYDGNLWHKAADYIEHLHTERKAAQPVLAALQDIPSDTLRTWIRRGFETVVPLAKAELARRGEAES